MERENAKETRWAFVDVDGIVEYDWAYKLINEMKLQGVEVRWLTDSPKNSALKKLRRDGIFISESEVIGGREMEKLAKAGRQRKKDPTEEIKGLYDQHGLSLVPAAIETIRKWARGSDYAFKPNLIPGARVLMIESDREEKPYREKFNQTLTKMGANVIMVHETNENFERIKTQVYDWLKNRL